MTIVVLLAAAGPGGCGGCGGSSLGGDGSTGQDAGEDAGGGDVRDVSYEAFCESTGPVVEVGDEETRYQACVGEIAARIFRNALCSCNDVVVEGYLQTHGFDSDTGPFEEGEDIGGGTVGINNSYRISAGYTDAGGSMSIAGPQSLSLAGYLKVRGDLRVAGGALVPGYTEVLRNAWFTGNFTGLGPLTVHGDLHQQGNVIAVPLTVDGATVRETVAIAPPCACGAGEILDVAALVDDARLHNDNGIVGLSPDLLRNAVGDVEVTLPCGRFYVSEISGAGNIIVNVTDRVALFVEGNVAAAGNLEFRLTAEGEVDIFVKGDLALIGRAAFGVKERPAATRIYVGGSGDVALVGAGGFVGNLYAPRSKVTAVGFAEVYGSVYAGDFLSPGYTHFVYDLAVTHAGDDCDTPPPEGIICTKCGTCPDGEACVDGVCGPCRTDDDCCGQDICVDGECTQLLL